MIRTKESIAVFSLVAIFACLSAAGVESNDANTPLTFELSTTELPAPQLNIVYTAPRVPAWKGTVAYVAGVAHNNSPYFLQRARRDVVERFIEFTRSQGLSEEQWRFLVRTHGGLEIGHSYTPPEDPNSSQLLLYAVSLDDAKKMAEAYLRAAQDEWRHQTAPIRDEVKKLSERLTDEQQTLPEANRAYEAAKTSFEDLQKQVPYRDPGQALGAAAELDKTLNTAQVDIAGMQAMLKGIQNHLTSLPRDGQEALKAKLEAMYVEQSVALQGAEARRYMATKLRKQADNYVDLDAAWGQAGREKDRLTHDVSTLPDMIRQAQEKLAAEMQQEPKIINDKVFIYPVKPASPPTIGPYTHP